MATINDTVRDTLGNPFTGVIKFTPASGVRVVNNDVVLSHPVSVSITNGALSINLTEGRYAVYAEGTSTTTFFINVPSGNGPYDLSDLIETVTASPVGLGTLNLASYGMSPDKTPAQNSTALQGAINDAPDGSVLFLPPGRYSISDTANIIISKTIHFTGIKGQSWLINGNAASNGANAFAYAGTLASSAQTTLRNNHYRGDISINVASATGLAVGEWIVIRDDRDLSEWHNDPAFDAWNEEIVRIESISGTTLVLNRPLARNYLVSRNAHVRKFTVAPPQPYISGLSFERLRVDLAWCVNARIDNCIVQGCDWANYSLRHCSAALLRNNLSESPATKVTGSTGAAFYIHHSSLCLVDGHVARNVEGAVLRRGSYQNTVTNSQFIGATTGLALYKGDCRYNLVSHCRFERAHLQWGDGGHFADSFNVSHNCLIIDPPNRALGDGNSAYKQVGVDWTNREFTAQATTGFDHGQSVMLSSAPTGFNAGRRYYVVAPTPTQFLLNDTPPRPPASVTVNTTEKCLIFSNDYKDGDAVTLHSTGLPGNTAHNRLYFLRLRTGNEFWLQRRWNQTATFDSVANTVTLSNAVAGEWQAGHAIMFTGGTMPTGLSAAPTVYYLKGAGPTVFTLASTPGGSDIDFTTNGSGTIYALSPVTSAETAALYVEGGPWLTMPSSNGNGAVITIAEGNVYDGHTIIGTPTITVHLYRTAGTVFRNLNIRGSRADSTTLFNLGNCTDLRFEDCIAEIHGTNSVNRIAFLSTCFNIEFAGGRYRINNSTGTLFGGSGNSGIMINRLRVPLINARARLYDSNIRSAIIRQEQVEMANYLAGSPASIQLVNDANITAIPGETGNVIVYQSALTAARTVTLDGNNAVPGDWIEVVRTGGGAFSLTINEVPGNTTLFTFAATPETGFVRFIWSGSAWIQTAFNKA